MAKVEIIDEKTIRINMSLEDAVSMVREAALHIDEYASEIVTIYEKMPEFSVYVLLFLCL